MKSICSGQSLIIILLGSPGREVTIATIPRWKCLGMGAFSPSSSHSSPPGVRRPPLRPPLWSASRRRGPSRRSLDRDLDGDGSSRLRPPPPLPRRALYPPVPPCRLRSPSPLRPVRPFLSCGGLRPRLPRPSPRTSEPPNLGSLGPAPALSCWDRLCPSLGPALSHLMGSSNLSSLPLRPIPGPRFRLLGSSWDPRSQCRSLPVGLTLSDLSRSYLCRPSPPFSLARRDISLSRRNVSLSSSAALSSNLLRSAASASCSQTSGLFFRAALSSPVGRPTSPSRERPTRFAVLFAVSSPKHLSLLFSTSANRFRSSLPLGGAAWGRSSPYGTAPLVAVGVTSSPSRRPLVRSSPIPNSSSSGRRRRRLSFSPRPAPSPRSLSSSLPSIVASSPLVSSALLWLSALAARCRWAAASCTRRLVSPRCCPSRSGAAGGSPRCVLGGSEGCRCWRARPNYRLEPVLARSVFTHAAAAQSPRAFRCGVVAPCTPFCQLRAVVRSKLQCLCALQIRMGSDG